MARAHRLQQLLPNSRLQVIEGAGHFVQEDQPQAVAEAVRTFLET
jgi:pimeloyl-ACP methyl ester carboxylesterase